MRRRWFVRRPPPLLIARGGARGLIDEVGSCATLPNFVIS